MSIYLSIDLDYWNQGARSLPHCRRFLEKVRDIVPASNRVMIDSHEDLLEPVNQSGCNELVNVDWHSDIVNIKDPIIATWKNWQAFNCGTWINFVNFQSNGKYTWIHPHKVGPNREIGRCHRPYNKYHNPFYSKWTDWKELQEINSKTPENLIRWDEVEHVGIVFSYDWVRRDLEKIWDIGEEVFGSKPPSKENAKLGY